MINPKNMKADKLTKIYPEEVAKRVPTFILSALVAIVILMAIGITLVQPYVDENADSLALTELIHTKESDIEIHPIKKSNSFKISNTNFSLGNNENEYGSDQQTETLISNSNGEAEAEHFIPENSVKKEEQKSELIVSENNLSNRKADLKEAKTKKAPKPRTKINQGIFSKRCLKYCILMYCAMCKYLYNEKNRFTFYF